MTGQFERDNPLMAEYIKRVGLEGEASDKGKKKVVRTYKVSTLKFVLEFSKLILNPVALFLIFAFIITLILII